MATASLPTTRKRRSGRRSLNLSGGGESFADFRGSRALLRRQGCRSCVRRVRGPGQPPEEFIPISPAGWGPGFAKGPSALMGRLFP